VPPKKKPGWGLAFPMESSALGKSLLEEGAGRVAQIGLTAGLERQARWGVGYHLTGDFTFLFGAEETRIRNDLGTLFALHSIGNDEPDLLIGLGIRINALIMRDIRALLPAGVAAEGEVGIYEVAVISAEEGVGEAHLPQGGDGVVDAPGAELGVHILPGPRRLEERGDGQRAARLPGSRRGEPREQPP
jgi:hypothetical protein